MKKPGSDTVGFLVGEVSRAFRRRFEAAIASAGLEITVAESRTLFHAARCGGIRQSALAERMGIEPMSLVNLLDRLEARGWIAREPDPDDRRAKIVRVTDSAGPFVERLETIARGVRQQAMDGFSAVEREAFLQGLERMRENLSASTEVAAA